MAITQQTTDVELLDKLLLQRKTLRPRFSLCLTYDEAVHALVTAVTVEIEMRHCKPDLSQYMQYIGQVAQFLVDPGPKFGLALMGTPGNGKTTMARAIYAILDSLASLDVVNGRRSHWVEMTSAKQIVRDYRVNYERWGFLCRQHCLIIDDFGEEPVEVLDYGNVINPVIDLLSQRYDDQRLTILTTNVTNSQIRNTYGDRIADRFNEMMQVVIFTNQSYRK